MNIAYIFGKIAMIFGIVSAININKDLSSPNLWLCLACIGFLYISLELKNDTR